jgi:TonB family protein
VEGCEGWRIKNPVFLLKIGFSFWTKMRIEIFDRIKVGDLKLFFSISLGIHLLLLSIVSILFPDFKIGRLPPHHIEISLLPLISEAKPLPKGISHPEVKTRIEKEEIKSLQEIREEESVAKKEQEQKIPTFQTVAINIPLEEPIQLPQHREEEKNVKELVTTAMTVVLSTDSDSNMKEVENPLSLKETSSKGENLSLPIPPSYTGRLRGTPSLDTGSQGGSQMVAKLSPHSEGEIFFAQPKYVENPKPLYPQEARKKGYEGEVLLKVEVLANGGVGRVEVKKSSSYEILDRSALTAVKEWKFIPANQGNGSIPCWVNIPIKFQLQ